MHALYQPTIHDPSQTQVTPDLPTTHPSQPTMQYHANITIRIPYHIIIRITSRTDKIKSIPASQPSAGESC